MHAEAQAFLQRLRVGAGRAHQMADLARWIGENTVLDDRPFSFKDHEFQAAIAQDCSRRLDVQKCSQVGLSELLIRKLLAFLAVSRHINAIYTMPTTGIVRTYAKGRIDPVIDNSPALTALMTKGNDSSELKQIGSTHLYLRGSFGQNVAISVPAELVVQDEIDFSNQQTLTTFASRLRHASLDPGATLEDAVRGYLWRFSTPTVPGYGISKGYLEGSQQRYLVRCRACGREQAPEFESHAHIPGYDHDLKDLDKADVDNPAYALGQAHLRCERCHAALDLSPPYRRWVAAFPDRPKASYRVCPWDLPLYNPLPRVIAQLKDYEIKADWANFVLGVAYADAHNSFLAAQIDQHTVVTPVSPATGAAGCVAGLDIGKTSWFLVGKRVGRHLEVLYATPLKAGTGEMSLVAQVLALCAAFGVVMLVVDAGPDFSTALTLIEKRLLGQTWACYYTRTARTDLQTVHVDAETSVITVHRTKSLDAAAQAVNTGEVRWPRLPEMATVRTHLDHINRLETLNDEGERVGRWVSKGPDHYAHALNYLRLAEGLLTAPPGPGCFGALPYTGRVVIPDGVKVDPHTQLLRSERFEGTR